MFFFSFLKFISFIYSWPCWVFVGTCGLSLVAENRDYSLDVVHRLHIAVASLATELRLSSCDT